MIDEQQKEDLKAKLNILDVVAHDGLTVVKRGNKYSTKEHDSLILYEATNSWTQFSQTGRGGRPLGGDIFAYYQHFHRCGFNEAFEKLSAMAGTLPQATVAQARREVKQSEQDQDYEQEAKDDMKRLQSAEGKPVAVELARRGISLDVAKRWGLGAHYWGKKLGWSIAFPRRDTNGKVIINCRLIERTEGDKCRRMGTGHSLFGARLAQPSKDKYLFAVEGELNAVSIGTAASSFGVDAVSIGNKSLSEAACNQLVTLATGYRRLFVWTDEAPDTQKILASVPGAIGYKSKLLDGKKMDANEMLQAGTLTGYIATLIERHADRSEAQLLYSALYQRHSEIGLDDATFGVAERIAAKWKQR